MSLAKRLKKIQESGDSIEGRFLEIYNKASLEVHKREEQGNPSKYYRPSSLGGCKRNIYYMRKQEEKDEVPEDDEWQYKSVGILQSGTDRHERIQEVIEAMDGVGGINVLDIEKNVAKKKLGGLNTTFVGWNEDKTEGRCTNSDLNISFQPDGLIEFEGKEMILEIKTTNSFKYQSIKKLNRPEPEHIFQATAYAMGLGVDYIMFMYEDRNFTDKHLILYKLEEEDKKALTDKIGELDYYMDNDILPPCEKDKCLYCNYKDKCEKDGC